MSAVNRKMGFSGRVFIIVAFCPSQGKQDNSDIKEVND